MTRTMIMNTKNILERTKLQKINGATMYQCRYLLTERDARGRYRKESWLSCTATAAGTRRMTDLSVDGLVGRRGEQNIQNSRGKTFHHGI